MRSDSSLTETSMKEGIANTHTPHKMALHDPTLLTKSHTL